MLENMLHIYVMDKTVKWEYYLHLVEFAYDSGKQALVRMSPFEYLYGRMLKTLVS